MKKLINQVDTVLTESLDGFCAAHADILVLGDGHKFVRRRNLRPGKVALISGGGSGHEPLHARLRRSRHARRRLSGPGVHLSHTRPDAGRGAGRLEGGAGVLFIVKNYEGDVMNFDMAAEMAAELGTESLSVRTNDDVAVEELALHDRTSRRRRHIDRREDRRRRGRDWNGPHSAEDARRQRQRAHPLNGRGADQLHGPRCRQADLRDRRSTRSRLGSASTVSQGAGASSSSRRTPSSRR